MTNLTKILPLTILPIAIFSIQPYTTFPIGNTFFWWTIQAAVLFIFWNEKSIFFDPTNKQYISVVNWYLIWNVFSIVRGVFIAETYWDWKGLVGNTMALLIPIVVYVASNPERLQAILSNYIKYTLPLFILFAFIISRDAYGFYLAPITYFILFFPVLKSSWKIMVIFIVLLIFYADLGARSNVIKFGVPVLLLFVYYFRLIISVKLLELIRKLLMIAPFILFSLGVLGIFNIFNMDEYVTGDYVELKRNDEGEIVEDKLTADTRTFLYIEVLQSAQNHNYWLLGRSPARGNDTEAFGDWALENVGRRERLSNESGILNVFTWTGIVGVILYLLVFWKASYLAINRSNNIFSKMIGLYTAFHWTYSWVETSNEFYLGYIMIWLMMGLCFSSSFRTMTNEEAKRWILGIFDRRYTLQNKILAENKIQS